MKQEERRIRWRNGHILQSVKNHFKLVPFILIIYGTSKQLKMMPQKDIYQSLKGLSWFESILCICSNRDFDKIFG